MSDWHIDTSFDRTNDRPDVTLTHIPARNDPDDSRETLAAQTPTPAARRVTDCIAWQDNPDHNPGYLLHDVERWFYGYLRREGLGARYDTASVAVGAYLLGRLDKAMEAGDPPDAGARALAFGLAGAGGFVSCLVLGAIGFWLSH